MPGMICADGDANARQQDSHARLTTSLAIRDADSDMAAIVFATELASSSSLSAGTTRATSPARSACADASSRVTRIVSYVALSPRTADRGPRGRRRPRPRRW